MIIKVDIGEVDGVDIKRELSISANRLEILMNDKKGDPLANLSDLALHALRVIELYKQFEK